MLQHRRHNNNILRISSRPHEQICTFPSNTLEGSTNDHESESPQSYNHEGWQKLQHLTFWDKTSIILCYFTALFCYSFPLLLSLFLLSFFFFTLFFFTPLFVFLYFFLLSFVALLPSHYLFFYSFFFPYFFFCFPLHFTAFIFSLFHFSCLILLSFFLFSPIFPLFCFFLYFFLLFFFFFPYFSTLLLFPLLFPAIFSHSSVFYLIFYLFFPLLFSSFLFFCLCLNITHCSLRGHKLWLYSTRQWRFILPHQWTDQHTSSSGRYM